MKRVEEKSSYNKVGYSNHIYNSFFFFGHYLSTSIIKNSGV